MYIPEFWCGVAACILGELAIILIAAVLYAINPNNNNANDKEDKS